jgi:hypothetical protein
LLKYTRLLLFYPISAQLIKDSPEKGNCFHKQFNP